MQQGKWTFGPLWMIVNVIGWGMYVMLAGGAGWIVWQTYQALGYGWAGRLLSDESNRLFIAMLILGLCWGAILGFLQQMVLKQRIDIEGKKWILATMIGILLYLITGSLLSSLFVNIGLFSSSLYIISRIFAFLSLPVLGTAQWFILRQHFAKSGWWIVTTVIASVLLMIMRSIMGGGGGRTYLLYSFVFLVAEGLLYGVTTWMALTVMTKQPAGMVEKE